MSPLLITLAKFGGPFGIVLAFSYLVIYGRALKGREPRLTKNKKYLLALAIVGFSVVTFFGWLSQIKENTAEITIQSTSGQNSPAISNTKGDVSVIYGEVLKQKK